MKRHVTDGDAFQDGVQALVQRLIGSELNAVSQLHDGKENEHEGIADEQDANDEMADAENGTDETHGSSLLIVTCVHREYESEASSPDLATGHVHDLVSV